MTQNLLIGFCFFRKYYFRHKIFYIRGNVPVVIRVFLISDFLEESLKANKTSKKYHSLYHTVLLKKPHSFDEQQLT